MCFQTVIITGANTGIGYETALDLARRDARVIIACRDVLRMESAVRTLKHESGNENIIGIELDLTSFASIRKFATEILRTEQHIDILINNAGVMAVADRVLTGEGLELQIATNHYGHFLLTNLLLARIKQSHGARIVTVSSRAHLRAKSIDFDDLDKRAKKYSAFSVYGESKLANLLFTLELNQRLEGSGVKCYALHPGVVATELARNLATPVKFIMSLLSPLLRVILKTPAEGAQTSIFAATSSTLDDISGVYLRNCTIIQPSAVAMDAGLAKKLWQHSETVVGL